MRVFLKKLNWRVLTLLCLLLFANFCFAEFSISSAKIRLFEDVYLLDAELNYKLTEEVIDALQNGVQLTLVLTIKIERERWYLWDEAIATLIQNYQLRYYALSKQYVLKYFKTGIERTFTSLNAALSCLNEIKDFPLLEKHLIEDDETYWVYLQIYLDIESLPVPLRSVAYLTSQWRLSSDWYLCPLQVQK